MLTKKFVFTLVGLLLAIFTIANMEGAQPVIEGWWGGQQRGVRAVNFVKDKDGNEVAINDYVTLNPNLGNDKFVSVPSFQALKSPRFNGGGSIAAAVRYNMPDQRNQAVPCNPIDHGNMASENFKPQIQQVKEGFQTKSCGGRCSGGCGPQCSNGGESLEIASPPDYNLPSNYMDGKGKDAVAYSANNNSPTFVTDLPVGTMNMSDADGNSAQPIVYQRLMYARPQGRLRQFGDPIRGDLAIVPCGGEWFSVHPNIAQDLQEGAMNVMGGVRNDSSMALAELIHKASGGTNTTIGGVDLAGYNPSTQYETSLSGAFGDINVVAYP